MATVLCSQLVAIWQSQNHRGGLGISSCALGRHWSTFLILPSCQVLVVRNLLIISHRTCSETRPGPAVDSAQEYRVRVSADDLHRGEPDVRIRS